MPEAPTIFEETDRTIPESISWAATVKASGENSLSYLIDKATAEGGTAERPAKLLLDSDVDYPTHASGDAGLRIPVGVVIEQQHDAKIYFRQAHSKFTLEGIGIKDVDKLTAPIFINAPCNLHTDTNQAAGQSGQKGVKWTDNAGLARVPQKISTLAFGFETDAANGYSATESANSNKSLTAKLNRADKAFKNLFVQINCHPDVIGKNNGSFVQADYGAMAMTRQVSVLEKKRNIFFLDGEFDNEYNKPSDADHTNKIEYQAPFLFDSDNHFRASPNAKVLQPPRECYDTIAIFNPRWQQVNLHDSVIFEGIENVSVKNFHILRGKRGGVLSSLGVRSVIASGLCRYFEASNNILDNCTGYGISIVSTGNDRNYLPEHCLLERNTAINMWSQVFVSIRGRDIRFLFNEVLNETVPTNDIYNNLRQVNFGGGFFDVEANATADLVQLLRYIGNYILMPRVMPATIDDQYSPRIDGVAQPFTFNSYPFILQGVEEGIEEFEFSNNIVQAYPFAGFGVVNGLVVNGTKGFRGKGNTFIGCGTSSVISIRQTAESELKDTTIIGTGGSSKVLDLHGNSEFKVDGLTVHNVTAPTILEREWFEYVVLADGNKISMARPFGFWGDVGEQPSKSRIYRHQKGKTFTLNGQLFKPTDIYLPPNIFGHIYKEMTSDVNFGSLANIEFSNGDITNNGVNKANHGLYTGQAVDSGSSGTFPVVSNVDPTGRLHIIAESADRFKFARTLAEALAGTAETIDIDESNGVHHIRPYKYNHIIVGTSAVSIANDTIEKTNHGLNSGAYLEYEFTGGGQIQNLYKYWDLIGLTSERSNGVYEVVKVDNNLFKLKYTDGENKGQIVNFGSTGTGAVKHIFTLAAVSRFTELHPAKYAIDEGVSVTLADNSKSSIIKPVFYDKTPVGELDSMASGLASSSDSLIQVISKFQKLILRGLPASTLKLDLISIPVWGAYGKKRLHHLFDGAIWYLSDGTTEMPISMDEDGNADQAAAQAFAGDRIVKWTDQFGNNHLTADYSHAPLLNKTTMNIRYQDGRYFNVPSSISTIPALSGFVKHKQDNDTGGGSNGGLWQFGNTSDIAAIPFGDGNVYETFGSSVRRALGDLTSFAVMNIYSVWSALNNWGAWKDGVALTVPNPNLNTVVINNAPTVGKSYSQFGGLSTLTGDMEWLALLAGVPSNDDLVSLHGDL